MRRIFTTVCTICAFTVAAPLVMATCSSRQDGGEPAVVLPAAVPQGQAAGAFARSAALVTEPDPRPILARKEPEPPQEVPVARTEEPLAVSEPEPEPLKESVIVTYEPKPQPVAAVEPAPAVDEKEEEYMRSVGDVAASISKETFEEDKKIILHIIDQLDTAMKNSDYKTWLTFVDAESIRYWSQRSNLQKAAAKLPVRGLSLNSLEDYFRYVFIGSRKGRRVDEIRYETDSQVKAVQVNGSNDTVYYNFKKSNGVWKLHLPPL